MNLLRNTPEEKRTWQAVADHWMDRMAPGLLEESTRAELAKWFRQYDDEGQPRWHEPGDEVDLEKPTSPNISGVRRTRRRLPRISTPLTQSSPMKRRSFLQTACTSAIAAMAGSRITNLAFAADSSAWPDHLLVVLFLRGGCDGFNSSLQSMTSTTSPRALSRFA